LDFFRPLVAFLESRSGLILESGEVQALLRWYRNGVDVQARLPSLATSMGHVSPISTAHILAPLDPLAQAASSLFADHAAAIVGPLADARGGR
jgi:hypothetical protein